MGKTDRHGLLVAVFGATGYTSRFVLKELLRRGISAVAIARNSTALSTSDFPELDVERRKAIIGTEGTIGRAQKRNC